VTLPPADPHDLAHADLVRARLFDRRTVVVSGALDDDNAARAVAELMTLDASGDDRIELLLNSAEGSLDAALMVMDVIDLVGVPVHATCIGRCEGPTVGALAVATRRYAVPHARLRLTVPTGSFQGRASDVVTWADAWQQRLQSFTRRVAAAMHRPEKWVETAVREGRYLDAHEALRSGLIDEITQPHVASVTRLNGGPLGFRPPP
jgi:ATP-dependent Clp protease protease subunit